MNHKNKKFSIACLVIISLVLFLFCVAFGFEETEIDRLKKKATVVEQKIGKSEAEVLKYSRKESAVTHSLDRIDFSLNKARRQISVNKSELSALEKKI